MDATVLILLILLIVYVPVWLWVWKSPRAAQLGLAIWGPAIRLDTKVGIRIMDRMSKYRRFWRFYGAFSQLVALGLMVVMIILMVNAVIRLPVTLQAGGVGIQYALALPGLNPIMPFWYTLLALIVALVFHEFSHGVQARANDIKVNHTGLIYAVVPLGAFVEPDEEDTEKASRKAKLHVYAAGITTNFTIAMVSFLLFSPVLLGGVTSDYDENAGVYSTTVDVGISPGAVITSVGGVDFIYDEVKHPLSTELWAQGAEVTVVYDTESAKGLTKSLNWGCRAESVISGSAAETAGIEKGDLIYTLSDGSDKKYIYTNTAFSEYMRGTSGGQTIYIEYYDVSEGTVKSSSAVLGSSNGVGFLGMTSSTTGFILVTTADVLGIGANPFYNADSVSDYLFGMISFVSHPFSGFDPIPASLHWWFNESFEGFWIAVSIFYWMFWLNILLGVTNALPGMPFDGGLIFRGWAEAVLERVSKKDEAERKRQAEEVAHNVSSLMLFLLAIVVIAVLV